MTVISITQKSDLKILLPRHECKGICLCMTTMKSQINTFCQVVRHYKVNIGQSNYK